MNNRVWVFAIVFGALVGFESGCSRTTSGESAPGVSGASDKGGPQVTSTGKVTGDGRGAVADGPSSKECLRDAQGNWNFKGKVTNPEPKPQKYIYVVSVVATQGFTTKQSKTIELTLQPKESKDVEAKAFYNSPAEGVTCTVHVTKRDA